MREIRPRNEPVRFTQWRAESQKDINYGYNLIPSDLRGEIKDSSLLNNGGFARILVFESMQSTHILSTCFHKNIVSVVKRTSHIRIWWPAIREPRISTFLSEPW